ncbi:aminotransferase class I/II-fold pyridoxal phosphate-dependent enzyme [Amycolatopsis sp. NBC_00348]|uniref:aminotransferase class I/II-fold pyridoxal phosphate-dependent enzyme n=1 Tax=Amycolatopsis sp. NBC_00348 TaxID=2975956 RepID=UPI002E2620F1
MTAQLWQPERRTRHQAKTEPATAQPGPSATFGADFEREGIAVVPGAVPVDFLRGIVRQLGETEHVTGQIKALRSSSAVAAAAAAVLGPGAVLMAVRLVVPEPGDRLPAQPENSEPGTPLWIPLGDAELRVLPGSHHWGPLRSGRHEIGPLDSVHLGALRSVALQAGELAVLQPFLVRDVLPRYGSAPVIELRYATPRPSGARRSGAPGGHPARLLLEGLRADGMAGRGEALAEVARRRAADAGSTFIDLGADRSETGELHQAVVAFFSERFDVELDQRTEIAVTGGASQALDALSRSLTGDWVVLPDLCPPAAAAISLANGARVLRAPMDRHTGLMDLGLLDRILGNLARRHESVRFLYFASPGRPMDAIADHEHLAEVVAISRRHRVLAVHDMDDPPGGAGDRVPNVLQVPGACEHAVTVAEGPRTGFLAGNPAVAGLVARHNSLFRVTPTAARWPSTAAAERVNRAVSGWRALGWPADAVTPGAGHGSAVLLAVPPGITTTGRFFPVELFAFHLAGRAFVHLPTSLSFNPRDGSLLRMAVPDDDRLLDELFDRLGSVDVHWGMEPAPWIEEELAAELQRLGR